MKALLTISFVFCILSVSPQEQKRTVIDQETSKPVPYTTIKVLNTTKGMMASATGEFNLSIEPSDTVLFTSVGYHYALLTGHEIKETISLKRKPRLLDTIIVKARKVLRSLILGNGADLIDKNIRCRYKPGEDNDCAPWGPGGKAEFAETILLPDSSKNYILKKVYLPLQKRDCWQPLFFQIYLQDTVTGGPGEMILQKHLRLEKEDYKKGKILLDLKSDNIYFTNTKAFFISVSWDTEFPDKDCITTLLLLKLTKGHTYSRSIHSPDYKWIQFRTGNNQNTDTHFHTIFAAEIEELESF